MTGERYGWLTLFRRRGDGTLTNAGHIRSNGTDIQTSNNSWPYVCDWDKDGRKDLLVGQEGIGRPCNVFVYLNQGTNAEPVFGDSTPVLANGVPFSNYRCVPVFRDLDRDSLPDLVLGEWYSSIRFYQNSGNPGSPLFTTYANLVPPDPDSFRNGNPPRIALADWDGDTDLDMITCDYYGWVTLRENITPTGVAGRKPWSLSAVSPTLLRQGPVRLTGSTAGAEVLVYDVAGNRVRNDSGILPGTYFVRTTAPGSVLRKVVVAR